MPNHIPESCSISSLADIEESNKGSLLELGEHCHIDSFVKIKFAGGMGDIRIGDFCYLNSGCVIYSGNGITIGNKVLPILVFKFFTIFIVSEELLIVSYNILL